MVRSRLLHVFQGTDWAAPDRRTVLAGLGAAAIAAMGPRPAAADFHDSLEALLDPESMIPVDGVVVPAVYRRRLGGYEGPEAPGSIVVERRRFFLYFVAEGGWALRYGCGLGRQGFSWAGRALIGAKQSWPDWYPPAEMRVRQPDLPEFMPGGLDNPLGARALYLHRNGRDTLYRIHGTREAASIGRAVSSGCVRLLNEDIIDLYERVPIGTPVLVV